MPENSSEEIKRADQEAQRILNEINKEDGNLEPAYAELQTAIEQYEQNKGKVDDLLPTGLDGSGVGLVLFRKGRKGEGFWRSFLKGIKGKLCDPDGAIRGLMGDGAKITTTSVITAIAGSVALPYLFIPPIAALIVSKGIGYWCREANNE